MTDFRFDVALTLSNGNAQEFLRSAYKTEALELHLSHETHDRVLSYTCAATGFRKVLVRALDELSSVEHPRTAAEQAAAFADLREHLLNASSNVDPDALVTLNIVGDADPAVLVEIDV